MEAMKLHVEVFYDDDVRQWGYTVPALAILGTGCNTRADAEHFALEAIQDVIESGKDDFEQGANVVTFDFQVARTG